MRKAVVFDMDGVIFDTEPLVMKVWEELGTIHHFDHVKEVCFECLGTNKETSKAIFLKHYGHDFPYDEYAKESSVIYHERYDGKVPLKPGVHELLTYVNYPQLKQRACMTARDSVLCQGTGIHLTQIQPDLQRFRRRQSRGQPD